MLYLLMLACAKPEPIYLTEEFYEWSCENSERLNLDVVNVSTETCEELVFIISEVYFYSGDTMKQRLYKEDCHWNNHFPLLESSCEEVEGVTLIAYY